MITAQVEQFSEALLVELKPLLLRHWQDLALDQDSIPLDPQYSVYFTKQASGEILCVTLRSLGRLVGYFFGFVAPGLHYRTCLTLIMDIYWVSPEIRSGPVAIRLIRAVLREAKRRGVRRAFFASKKHKDTGRLFEAFGFRETDVMYSKLL